MMPLQRVSSYFDAESRIERSVTQIAKNLGHHRWQDCEQSPDLVFTELQKIQNRRIDCTLDWGFMI